MQTVSWKRQLVLATTLFVIGSLAYWLEYQHKPKKEAADEQAKKIFQLKDTPIQSIRLVDGAKAFTLNCLDGASKLCKSGDNSKWELSEPSKLRADDTNSNSLVSALNNLNVSDTIDLKDETAEKRTALLKEYGLDPASRAGSGVRKLYVTTTQGQTVVYLGLTHPIGDAIFGLIERKKTGESTAAADETKVYLVPNYFKSNFEHDLTYWRDKKLFSLSAHEIDGFGLEGGKGKISGERKDGQWTLHSGGTDYAGDVENIDSLLTGATYLTAKGFASDDKKDKKAKSTLTGYSSVLTLTLQKEKGSAKETPAPVTVAFFMKKKDPAKGKLYATVSALDPLFELENNAKDRMDKSLKDLRMSKLITSMDRFTAKKLEIKGKPIGASPVLLGNIDGKWVAMPDKHETNSEKIQTLLDRLSGNRIKDFLEGKNIPKGEVDGITLTLGDDKTDTKRQFTLWKDQGRLYAHDLLSTRNEAFLVDNSIVNDLPWDIGFFKKSDAKKPDAIPGK